MIQNQYRSAESQPADALIATDTVSRMADVMNEMEGAGQTVTADALALRGFSRAEIERHGRDAADLALSRSVRQRAA